MNKYINREIDVTAFYFNRTSSRCFPSRIELDGQPLAFLESGLRCLVRSGQRMVEVFNMTDGYKQYNLRFEPEQRLWTLINIRAL